VACGSAGQLVLTALECSTEGRPNDNELMTSTSRWGELLVT